MQSGRFHPWIAAGGVLLAVAACDRPKEGSVAMRVAGGDAARGAMLVRQNGCPVCHSIPSVRAVGGKVGPPLGGLVDRAYIAGGLPNRPAMVARFIVNPPRYSPQTAMPGTALSPEDARHITAFLYSLPSAP